MILPPLYPHKTDAMRKLQNLVSRGHARWTAGQIEPRKLPALCLKFADRYGIERPAQQRWRAKAQVEASAHLVFWPGEPQRVHWWLVVSPGGGLVVELEQLQDAGRQRIEVTGYELVRMPRQGRAAAWTSGGPEFNFTRSDSFVTGKGEDGKNVSILDVNKFGKYSIRYNAYRFSIKENSSTFAFDAFNYEISRADKIELALQPSCAVVINNATTLHCRDIIKDNRRLLIRIFGYSSIAKPIILCENPLLVKG